MVVLQAATVGTVLAAVAAEEITGSQAVDEVAVE